VYGFTVKVTAPLRLSDTVRARGREQLASLRTVAMMSGRMAVIPNESLGRFGEVRRAKRRRFATGSGGGPLGTLLSLDAATCAAVAFFLLLLPFLVTCAQVAS